MSRRGVLGRAAGALALAAAGVSGAVSTRAFADGRIRLLTSWFAQAEHGGYYQAVATGLYHAAGLDVSIDPGGPQINNAQLLLAGSADFTLYGDMAAVEAAQRGLPLVCVATTYQTDPFCIITHPDIHSLAQLKGHKILIASAEQPVIWPLLKRRYGFSDDQLGPYTYNLQPFLADPDLAIQSFATSEPYELQKLGAKFNVLLLRDAGFPSYSNPVVTRRDLLSAHPQTVRAFLHASMQGWKSYLADPEPANRLILAANPHMTAERIAFTLAQTKRLHMVTGGDAATGGIGIMTDARWQQIADTMKQLGLLQPGDWRMAYDLTQIRSVRVMPS